MKRCFTSLTALLCSAAILLCSLPMQALAVEFRMQTAYEDVLPDELTAQKEAPEAEKQPEAPPEEPTVSVLSTDNRSGDFTYSVLSDNTAQITGYSGTAANLIVPDKLDGYTVTEIGKLCFSGNITLVSLKLPDTVTRIGTKAFAYCTNLASINYPLHLESAGDYYNGGYLFDGTRISSITVPEGVTELPSYVFQGAYMLTEVQLPTTLTSIGSSAFSGCSQLPALCIPIGETQIGMNAFTGCTELRQAAFLGTKCTFGRDAFKYSENVSFYCPMASEEALYAIEMISRSYRPAAFRMIRRAYWTIPAAPTLLSLALWPRTDLFPSRCAMPSRPT